MTQAKYFRPLAIFSLLIVLITAFWIAGIKQITLLENGETRHYRVFAFTVGAALLAAEIDLVEQDKVEPALNTWLHENQEIIISPASQITILADGEVRTLLTTERFPVALLALADIQLGAQDQLLVDGLPGVIDQALSAARAHSLQVRRVTSINLEIGAQSRTIQSTALTLGAALWDAGIQLYQSDQLNPPPQTPLEGGAIHATLIRSQQITIRVGGKTLISRTTAQTVADALADAGTSLQGLDYSLPPANASLPENRTISIVRVREEVVLENSPLPFSVSTQPLPDVPLDTLQVVGVGAYGLMAQRVRIRYEAQPESQEWHEISREVEDEWVAREPQPRITGYGTQVNIQTVSTAHGPIEIWRTIEAYATSYSPCNLGIDGCNSTTYSGKTLTQGMIAVKRSWYAYMGGLQVYIPGYGFATIEDIGGGISGKNWVDLGYEDETWISWHQNVTVYFLTPIPPSIMVILD
jgi:uncharacterized protein YabE (DUF348 family)